MDRKRLEKCIILLFCGALGLMLALFLLLPKKAFSEKEKRYLTEAPRLNAQELFSGAFSETAEDWAADHLPGRDLFVGLNAWYDYLVGRQGTKEIYRGKSGRLYEAPTAPEERQIARKADAIRKTAEVLGRSVDLMLVPSAGYVLRDDMPVGTDPYADDRIQAELVRQADDAIKLIDLFEVFSADAEPGSLYYRTDHHWTSRGAQLAAALYLTQKGRTALHPSDYRVTTEEGFYGTTYSRSALWGTHSESIELWASGGDFQAENADGGRLHEGLFYTEHLEEIDKYPVYLDGNHSLVRIHNPKGSGKLLLIRDSFGSCMAGFLADSYEEIVLVDLRYYRSPVSELAQNESFDDILILYGMANFMSDLNLERVE